MAIEPWMLFAICTWVAIFFLLLVWLEQRQKTNRHESKLNTHSSQINKLDISVKDLWEIIHGNKNKEG